MPGIARGQDQHRRIDLGCTPMTQHLQSIPARQTQIEYDGIVRFLAAHMLCINALGLPIDSKPLTLQILLELGAKAAIIFDKEYPHVYSGSQSMRSVVLFIIQQLTGSGIVFQFAHQAFSVDHLQFIIITRRIFL